MTELRRPLGGSLARTLNLIERVLEVEEGVVVRRIPDDGVLERRDAVVEERLTLAEVLRPEAEAVDVPALERSAPDEELLAELGRLSPEHRAVIVLRYLLEYTPGEIAELLELPRGTVNSRLRRGLDTLKERL